jgi:fatty-acyl-CoA synthase
MTLDDLRQSATIADVLRENVYVRPSAEAVTDGTRRLSWKQLHDAALSSCAHFAALGVQRGDRIGVVLPNQIEAVVLYWACALSGTVFVGANPRLGQDDLENLLRHSGTRLVFASDDVLAQRISAMALPDMTDVVNIEASEPVAVFLTPLRPPNKPVPLERDDTFAICYTSGTTGRPKGAVLSHGNLVWNAATTSAVLDCTDKDTFLCTVGITHIFGLSATVLTAAVAGARTVMLKTFAAGAALDLCEWEGVTVLHGNPTMFVLELAAQRRAPRDLSKLRTGIVAAAPVTPELADQIRTELGCDVQIAWGLTETAPAVTMTHFSDPADVRRSTVGRALPEAQIRIDTQGHEYGEILVKSPGVFQGYYKDPDLTAQSFTADGWFKTGDLGYIDPGGFLHLKGRSKEIIIRGGLHVYPEEVEQVILLLPWVAGVSIVGIPDPVLGERTCACVVVDGDACAPEDILSAVRQTVSQRLADYKVPDTVLRVAELPRTSSGKVLRGVLREDAIARIAAH